MNIHTQTKYLLLLIAAAWRNSFLELCCLDVILDVPQVYSDP